MKEKKKGFSIPMDKRLYSRANCIRLSERLIESGRIIDLADNGDTLIRRIVYRILWIMPAFPIKDDDRDQ